jgi:hypothetical protein
LKAGSGDALGRVQHEPYTVYNKARVISFLADLKRPSLGSVIRQNEASFSKSNAKLKIE